MTTRMAVKPAKVELVTAGKRGLGWRAEVTVDDSELGTQPAVRSG